WSVTLAATISCSKHPPSRAGTISNAVRRVACAASAEACGGTTWSATATRSSSRRQAEAGSIAVATFAVALSLWLWRRRGRQRGTPALGAIEHQGHASIARHQRIPDSGHRFLSSKHVYVLPRDL